MKAALILALSAIVMGMSAPTPDHPGGVPVPAPPVPVAPVPGSPVPVPPVPTPPTVPVPAAPKSCFARDGVVTLDGGKKVTIADLKVGDRVLAVGDDGQIITTPVLRRTYDEVAAVHTFLRFRMESGATLEVTPRHYVFASACCHFHATAGPKFADEARVGESMFVVNPVTGKAEAEKIVAIETVAKEGAINVHTVTGTIIVNGVAATHFTAETTFGAAGRAYLAPVWYSFLHYVVRPAGLGHHFGL